jgi:hypothetical protein
MAGLVPAIHAFVHQPVDARHKAGHDWLESCRRWHDAPVEPGQCCMARHAWSLAEPSASGNRQPEFGEKAMLQQHRPGVRLCLERAGECERLAELLAGDPRSRETYVRMASQWRALAAQREFVEQIDGLLASSGTSKRQELEASPSSALG